VTNNLLDTVEVGGDFEFVERFAYPYIGAIIGRLVVADDTQDFDEIRRTIQIREKSTPAKPSADYIALLESALTRQNSYFEGVFSDRRKCPKSDIATRLLQIQPNGNPLTKYEMYSALDLFLSAGFHTTAQVLASAMLYLAQLPNMFVFLKANPDRIPDFIEELLRMDGPTHRLLRTVKKSIALHGYELQPGELCSIIVSAANHDPAYFSEPEKFDIDRPNNKRHFEFGYGAHTCIGASLARTEIRVALEEILERYKDINCTITDSIEWISTVTTRGIRALRVRYS
jgi:cytochrome P450